MSQLSVSNLIEMKSEFNQYNVVVRYDLSKCTCVLPFLSPFAQCSYPSYPAPTQMVLAESI